MAAIEGALLACGPDTPVALALTKCERWLPDEADQWDRSSDWLTKTPLWTAHSATLKRFAGRAWPVSAFGFDPETALPAMILSEMGTLLPYNIRPRNVAAPLAALLSELQCL
jgi:hypothetical protein